MASYEQNENREWSVRFRYAEFGKLKQKRLRGFKTKKEAEKAYSDFVTTHIASNVSDYSQMKFSALYDNYIVYIQSRLKPSTIYDLKHNFERHLLPVFKDMKFFSITKKDIFNWQQSLNKECYSYKFKTNLRGLLSAIFRYAVYYFELPANPVLQVEPFKRTEPKKEMDIWSKEDFEKFINNVEDETFKTFFAFLYLTGCRKGEAFALTWNKIDFNNQLVTINQNLIRKIEGQFYAITTTKTNNTRTIMIPKYLISLLAKLKYEQDNFSEDNFVFGGKKPLAENTTTRVFNRAIEKAGVKKLHLHCLRHSHASLLISQGESIVMVSKRLGHATIEQTLNTYSHLMPNEEQKMISKLEINL